MLTPTPIDQSYNKIIATIESCNTKEHLIGAKKMLSNFKSLYGISSNHRDGITTVKKASFTSCSKNNKCPPWHLEASEIKHDKNKKQLND